MQIRYVLENSLHSEFSLCREFRYIANFRYASEISLHSEFSPVVKCSASYFCVQTTPF